MLQVSEVEISILHLVKIKVSQMSVLNCNSRVCSPLPLHFPGRVHTVLQRRIFWAWCLLMEPIPAVQSSCRVTAGVSSGLLTMQSLGVCENETSLRETFIWISQQVRPKCVYVPLLINTHSQAWWIWYPFRTISLTDWKGKGFFFQCHASFQCLADNHFPDAPCPPTE